MQTLTLSEFEVLSAPESSEIDAFCSSPDWLIPAYQAFAPEMDLWLRKSSHGFAAFVNGSNHSGQRFLHSLDVIWGFASPLVSFNDFKHLLEDFVLDLPQNYFDFLVIGGLKADSQAFFDVIQVCKPIAQLYLGTSATRCLIDLSQGVQSYLQRRSANFRHSLNQSFNRSLKENIYFEDAGLQNTQTSFQRILKIEQKSWKGEMQEGLMSESMQHFYFNMMQRLQLKNKLQLIFAKKGEQDIGYLLGAVHGKTYRGLQFSYIKDFKTLGIGNLLQWQQMLQLEKLDIPIYDMGMEMPYKHRFADSYFTTQSIIVSLK